MSQVAAMKQALEALGKIEEHGNVPGWCEFDTNEDAVNYHEAFNKGMKASTALRAAIAKQEKAEPVAWRSISDAQWMNLVNHAHAWEGFSKDEAVYEVVKMTEAKCKENNTHHAPVPAGWQLVPVEPTEEMIRASWDLASVGMFPDGTKHYISIAYKAMLAAAPKPGEMK